jgi:hypothetical protein
MIFLFFKAALRSTRRAHLIAALDEFGYYLFNHGQNLRLGTWRLCLSILFATQVKRLKLVGNLVYPLVEAFFGAVEGANDVVHQRNEILSTRPHGINEWLLEVDFLAEFVFSEVDAVYVGLVNLLDPLINQILELFWLGILLATDFNNEAADVRVPYFYILLD